MTSLGFAFQDYDTIWRTMDGELGNHIRADIAKTQIFAFDKIWDNGFRQITSSSREIRTPDDLNGFKIRVPPAPPLTSLFKAFGAAPAPINFNELYTALQTRIVDGQENPLAIIATTRLYEVQKSCSLSGHVWDGYWVLGNKRSFARLPADLQKIVADEINRSALDQRADIAKLSDSLKAELTTKGISFVDIDREAFRKALAGTAFYAEWKQKYGEAAWSILEKTVGKLG
jgi:tripartite ATP-independent transporter DctP family solute receptor